jgi:hypothetical protein
MGVKLEDHIAKLLKRVDEWIAEQKETAGLEKARVDEGKTDYQKQAARADRAGSWEKENLGTAGSGHSKTKEITHFLHNSKLDQIKRSPKPNFPAEPVDKSIEDQMFYEKHKKQVHQEGKARRAAIEQKKSAPSLVEKLSSWVNKPKAQPSQPQAPVEQKPDKLAASEKTPIVMTAKQAVKEHKELVHVLKTPSHKDDLKEAKEQGKELKEYKGKLDKSANSSGLKSSLDLNHVASVPTPKELHPFISSGATIPYNHPHRELAAKFVTDVWRKNKPEGMRMSSKLLGVDEHGQKTTVKAEKKDYAAPTPADVSAPAIINERRTNTGRRYISGPDIISGYPSSVGESGQPKDKDMKKSELVKSLKKLFGKELEKAQSEPNLPSGVKNLDPRLTHQRAARESNEKTLHQKGVHIPRPDSGITTERANNFSISRQKDKHKNVLSNLKAMPKPNLPKSEPIEKARVDEGKRPEQKRAARANRGNDKAFDGRPEFSNFGDQRLDRVSGINVNDRKNADSGQSNKHKSLHILKELKAMPKPNLPKSEKSLEKLDPTTHQPGTMLDKSSPEYLYKMKTFCDGLKKYCSSKMEKANNFEAKSGLKGQDVALKMVRAANPNSGPKGVHKPFGGKDTSIMGQANRGNWSAGDPKSNNLQAKKEAVNVLGQMSKMPKPNLPKSEASIAKSDSSLKKNSKFKELEAKLNAIMPSKPVNPEIQAAAKAKVAAGMQAKAKHDQMQKDKTTQHLSEQKLKQDLLLPENLKLDRPKYLTLQQGHEAILNGKPNPMQEAGKNKPQHLDDIKKLNAYHGKNIITGVHDQPVKSWGNETYLMHPDGKLDFQHAEYDTSDARK